MKRLAPSQLLSYIYKVEVEKDQLGILYTYTYRFHNFCGLFFHTKTCGESHDKLVFPILQYTYSRKLYKSCPNKICNIH